MITVKIRGAKKISKKLKAIPSKMESRILRNAIHEGARFMRDQFRDVAPKGRTGILKKSIIAKRRRMRRGVVRSSVIITTGKGFQAKKRDAFYWRFLHYGTKYIEANTFLEDTWSRNRTQIIQRIMTRIRIDFNKIV